MALGNEHVELLGKAALFHGVGKSTLRQIAGLTRVVDHEDGHAIVRAGWGAHAMHLIVDGAAVVSVEGTEVARLGPGDSFGEVALFDHGPRTATVTADGSVKVLAIDGVGFRHLVEKDGKLAGRLLTRLASVIRATNGSLCEWEFPTGGGEEA